MKEDLFFLGIKALIRNSEGKILLLKLNPALLKPHPSWDGSAYWDIPGGRIKRGSTTEETLAREVQEETGATEISDIKPITTIVSTQRVPVGETDYGLMLSIYSCSIPRDGQIILSIEHLEFDWFAPEEASKLLQVKYPPQFTDIVAKLI